jgi:hypothetical protein
MAASEPSIDSFVDIVTNTAGILILLVILSIMRSQEAGTSFNPALARLAKLRERNATAEQGLADLRANIDRAREEAIAGEREFGRRLAGLSESGHDIAGLDTVSSRAARLESARDERASMAVRLADLNAEDARLKNEADQAVKGSASKLSALGADESARVVKTPLADMAAGLVAATETSKGLSEKVDALTTTAEERRQRLALDRKRLSELDAQRIVVREARSRRDLRPRHYFECYLPPKAQDADGTLRPCVRRFDPAHFVREGNALKATAEGESTFRVLDEDSTYRTFLAAHDREHREKHIVHFAVHPDAFAAFRLARTLAWGAGWEVDWSLIEAPRARPAVTPAR